MSIHSSLRSGGAGKKHRSVLKRYERLKILKDKNLWTEEKKTVYGIPKVKMQKLKVKKEKAAATADAGAGAPAAGASAAKPAAAAKAAPAAKGEKK